MQTVDIMQVLYAGTMYNYSKVTNCIVKGSSMGTPSGALGITAATNYVSLGGIAGSVGNNGAADPSRR